MIYCKYWEKIYYEKQIPENWKKNSQMVCPTDEICIIIFAHFNCQHFGTAYWQFQISNFLERNLFPFPNSIGLYKFSLFFNLPFFILIFLIFLLFINFSSKYNFVIFFFHYVMLILDILHLHQSKFTISKK